jgi:hypothetical protein
MEAELVREGLAFATVGVYNDDVMTKTAPDASPSGFTEFDLATLNEFSSVQKAERRWGRTQLVHLPFADFLAAWTAEAANAELPHLTIARFKRTGTYALTVGAAVVATAPTLDRILPIPSQAIREVASVARDA